jgi:hypothetical protein
MDHKNPIRDACKQQQQLTGFIVYFQKHTKRHEIQSKRRADTLVFKFQCELCISVQKSARNLQAHMKLKHGESKEPQECPECSKMCQNDDNLYKHFKYCHPNAPRQKCQDCDKVFITAAKVENHWRTTHAPKNLDCHLCSKKFREQNHYEQHLMKKHHLAISFE